MIWSYTVAEVLQTVLALTLVWYLGRLRREANAYHAMVRLFAREQQIQAHTLAALTAHVAGVTLLRCPKCGELHNSITLSAHLREFHGGTGAEGPSEI